MAFIWTDDEQAWYGVTFRDGFNTTVLANDADDALERAECKLRSITGTHSDGHGGAVQAEWIEAHEAALWPQQPRVTGRDAEDEAYDRWRDDQGAA